MKIFTATASTTCKPNSKWLLCSTLFFSIICFSQVQAADLPKSGIKPRAAATTTPLEWSEEYGANLHEYVCAVNSMANSVLIGRAHVGDENGKVKFRCATVHQFGVLSLANPEWSNNQSEHDHRYQCPGDKVMTGMKHSGDEEEPTLYQCSGVIDAWENPIQPVSGQWQRQGSESNHTFECAANTVMTGRTHRGDENAPTEYLCATLW